MKLLCRPREQLCALGNKVVRKLKGEMFRQSHAKRHKERNQRVLLVGLGESLVGDRFPLGTSWYFSVVL